MQTSDPSSFTDRSPAQAAGAPDSAGNPRAIIPPAFSAEICAGLKARFSGAAPVLGVGRRPFGALSSLPRIIHACVLSRILPYFFDPLSGIVRNKVAVLVTFGALAKHNEVIAFKTSGVCLHRMTLPGAPHPRANANLTRLSCISINPLSPLAS
ncbi:MAG: hypothetical protein EXQ52_06990 [Bryobacterales bacterium]|nr:hypothetical protein [Bryobacterales bacterium]